MILTSFCLLTSLAAVPPQQDEGQTQHLLTFRMGELDSFFADSKDAALLGALHMADARLRELPEEIDGWDMPPGLLELGLDLIGGSSSLSLDIGARPVRGMPLPVLMDLRLGQGSPEEALRITSELTSFMGQMGAPVEEPAPGSLWSIPAPVPVWLGASSDDFVVRLGQQEALNHAPVPDLLPEGSQLYMSGDMDYGTYMTTLMDMISMENRDMGSAEFGLMSSMLSMTGMMDMQYEFAAGFDADRQYMITRMPGWAESAKNMGLGADGGIGADVFEAIPVDATWAFALSFDMTKLMAFYATMLEPMGINMSEVFAANTGMSLEDDVLAAFGSNFVMYASDSTGGGGALSTVGLIELGDTEAFLNLLNMAEALGQQLGQSELDGHFRIDRGTLPGVESYKIVFPGMPVPLEVTLAVAHQHLVIGATPQAVQVALGQLMAPESSLLHNATMRAQLDSFEGELSSMFFIDTPRLMNDGYGTINLMASALANSVRSPLDSSREPGMVMPTLPGLKKDAKGILLLTYNRGEDYFTEYRLDRSHLVNAVGATGFFYNSPIVGLIGLLGVAGSTASGVSQSFSTANYAKAEIDLDMLYMAAEAHALDNNGVYAGSIEELQQLDADGNGYLPADWVNLDPWGSPYVYEAPDPSDDYSFLSIYSANIGYGYDYGYGYEDGYEYGYGYGYEYGEEYDYKYGEEYEYEYGEEYEYEYGEAYDYDFGESEPIEPEGKEADAPVEEEPLITPKSKDSGATLLPLTETKLQVA